jgi:hypothetical protein
LLQEKNYEASNEEDNWKDNTEDDIKEFEEVNELINLQQVGKS